MTNYPSFPEILAFIINELRKENGKVVSHNKLKSKFSNFYEIKKECFSSVMDKYIFDSEDEESDLLSYVFCLATNILKSSSIIRGDSSYTLLNDSIIENDLKYLTLDHLRKTNQVNLMVFTLLAEVANETFYYSMSSNTLFSYSLVKDDVSNSIRTINGACYDYTDTFLIELEQILSTAFTSMIGFNIDEKPANIKLDLIERIKNLSPLGFEKFCLFFLENILNHNGGIVQVEHMGKVGDFGFDGTIINKNILDGDCKYYIQCKRYKKTNVQRSEIQAFIGAMSNIDISANKGIFLTASRFSTGARNFNSNKQLRLFDIDEIVNLMLSKNIGIKEISRGKTYTIDQSIFNTFT